LAQELGIPQLETIDGEVRYARHPLVYLVEAADDICYEIMDIEDAHKLRLLSDEETLSLFLGFFDEAEQEAIMKPYAGQIDVDDQIVYLRSCVINALERACVEIFVDHEEEILAGTLQGSLIDHLPKRLNDAYKHCEKVAVRKIYQSRSVTDIDLSGYRIIYTLIELLTDAVTHPEKAYSELILKQVSAQYQVLSPVFSERMMAVLD
jgi:dGTPase